MAAARAVGLVGAVVLGGCAGGEASLDAALTQGPTQGLAQGPKATGAASAAPAETKAVTGPAAAAIATARSLKAKGDKPKALAELEKARQRLPKDRDLARETGFLALELGQLDKARVALEVSHDPAKPDWRTLSALGTVHASAGNQTEAQAHFAKALALKPDHQPTLNNLAMSQALAGDLRKAEATLRSAAKSADVRQVRENLALVLALAGKYDEAEKAAASVWSKAQVASNLAYLRSLKQKDG
jgi:Flp pilus assembly protein TadD